MERSLKTEFELDYIQKSLKEYNVFKDKINQSKTMLNYGDHLFTWVVYKIFGTNRHSETFPSFNICASKKFGCDNVIQNDRFYTILKDYNFNYYVSFDVTELVRFLTKSGLEFKNSIITNLIYREYCQYLLEKILICKPKFSYKKKDWNIDYTLSREECEVKLAKCMCEYLNVLSKKMNYGK